MRGEGPRGRRGSPLAPPIDQAPPRHKRSRLALARCYRRPRPTSDAFKLLASCVSCATAVVCVVALAAPVTDSPTGGGGAFRHMSGATERAREISRHRLQLQRELKRCRGEVEAHATELDAAEVRVRASLGAQPAGWVVRAGAAAGGEIFWGAEGPVPRGRIA